MMITNEKTLYITKKPLFITIEQEYLYDFFKLIEYAHENIGVKIDAMEKSNSQNDVLSEIDRIMFEMLEELLNSTFFIEQQKGIELNQFDLYLLKEALSQEKERLEYIVQELDESSYSQQTLLVLKNILHKLMDKLEEGNIQVDVENFIQLNNKNKWEFYWEINTLKYNETKIVTFS